MDDRYAKLRAAQQSIGVSDWQWWDSNSFRRLTFIEANGRHGQDGGALCAVVQPSDGHPDVQMASGVREFIEACSPDTIRALLADYEEAERALILSGKVNKDLMDTVLKLRKFIENEARKAERNGSVSLAKRCRAALAQEGS